ncbi:MAG: riboflavin biosynthesis protein RibF [Saprospiraceae bacterium]
MRVFKDLQHIPGFNNAVATIGSFDGVHLGHVEILRQIQRQAHLCGGESVVVTFNPHPRLLLEPQDPRFRLINTLDEKLDLLRCQGVDNAVVVPFDQRFAALSAQEYVEDFLIKKIHPRYVVIGYDHRFGANREGDIAFLKKYERNGGFQTLEIPAQQIEAINVSSTQIRRALEQADIPRANRLLGRPFPISGRVVTGRQIGRSIGFPTANIQPPDPYKFIPPNGIYAAQTTFDGQTWPVLLYIGERPSVESANACRTIEAHLVGFEGDLYGQNLSIDVIDYVRPDRKLDSLDALQAQIRDDQNAILARLREMNRMDPKKSPARADETIAARTAPHAEGSPLPLSDVAIVILNFNTRPHLETFLPSVVAHTDGARIIVADNASPDDSVAWLAAQYPDVAVIRLPRNYGFAQGYNEALDQVQARYYILLNSDVQVSPGWLPPLIAAMEADPLLAAAQPKIRAYRQPEQFEYAGGAGGWIDTLGYPFCRGRIFNSLERDLGQYDDPISCAWASGAAMCVRADLYRQFGGFDSDYFAHNEEIDLCLRFKRAGYRVGYVPTSLVFHLGGGSLAYSSPRKVFFNFRNSLLTLLKNEPRPLLAPKIFARLCLDGVAGIRFLLKGEFRAILAVIRAHFSFYGMLGAAWRKRQQVARIIEDARVGPPDRAGIYPGSIVFAHYIRRIKKFSDLMPVRR